MWPSAAISSLIESNHFGFVSIILMCHLALRSTPVSTIIAPARENHVKSVVRPLSQFAYPLLRCDFLSQRGGLVRINQRDAVANEPVVAFICSRLPAIGGATFANESERLRFGRSFVD